VEAQVLGAAGQAVLDPRHLQEVGRPGKSELSRCLVAVHAQLDLGDQLGDALDLLDAHRGLEGGDEPSRVGGRSGPDSLVVERQDLAARALGGSDLFQQRALADLASAEYDD
jgi:hypothetical protein